VIHASDVNASDIVVENCEIYGFKVRGIRTASNMQIQRLRVVNNYIHDIGNIDHPDTPSPLCFGTMLMNGGGCGFGIQPGAVHDGSIAGNIIEHVGTRDGNWGIYASDNSGLTIVGNFITASAGGIKILGGKEYIVSDNIIDLTMAPLKVKSYYGIYLASSPL